MGSEGFSTPGAVCLYIVGALEAACFSETFKFIYIILIYCKLQVSFGCCQIVLKLHFWGFELSNLEMVQAAKCFESSSALLSWSRQLDVSNDGLTHLHLILPG